ncbi:MAG: hypothetical protein HFF98_10315 [Oscillibacter sp.]|jgi:hypothetical protein|nr:hypothetical protein [Oscillibacter sp.]
MELFDKIAEKIKSYRPAGDRTGEAFKDILPGGGLVLASTSHTAEEIFYGDGDSEYRTSFRVNDAFKPAKSHAGEVDMLHTYAPNAAYGEEGTYPCLAILSDDVVYTAVEEFKETGVVKGVMEFTPLSGTFYFKARIRYYENLMYFYGMDCCGGYMENQGLCIIYPKALVGTEIERKLTAVLDEAAESYREERKA